MMNNMWKHWPTQTGLRPASQNSLWRQHWQHRFASCANQHDNGLLPNEEDKTMQTMKANVFRGPNKTGIEEVPRPSAGVGEAVIRITLTTICGTDLHILRGEYPVK